MSFLSKLGATLLKVGAIAAGIQPLIEPSISHSASGILTASLSELQGVASVISTMEAIKQTLTLKGTDALKAATPLVAQEIMKSALLVGKKVENEALFTLGAQKIADGMVDVLDSIHESGVKQIATADLKYPSPQYPGAPAVL